MALKKAIAKKTTQKQTVAELKVSERQVRRMLSRLKLVGSKAVVHGLRGRSNHQLREEDQQKAIEILSSEVYKGFGPTICFTAGGENIRVFLQYLEALPPGSLRSHRTVAEVACGRTCAWGVSPAFQIIVSRQRVALASTGGPPPKAACLVCQANGAGSPTCLSIP